MSAAAATAAMRALSAASVTSALLKLEFLHTAALRARQFIPVLAALCAWRFFPNMTTSFAFELSIFHLIYSSFYMHMFSSSQRFGYLSARLCQQALKRWPGEPHLAGAGFLI